jgi:hypothetical protein
MVYDPGIRVIKAAEQDALAWETIPVDDGDPNPPGEEVLLFRAGDMMFSFGIWRRAPETGPMEPPYHEVAVLIEARSSSSRRTGPSIARVRRRDRDPEGIEGDGRPSAR